jgi:hypothetical protein
MLGVQGTRLDLLDHIDFRALQSHLQNPLPLPAG